MRHKWRWYMQLVETECVFLLFSLPARWNVDAMSGVPGAIWIMRSLWKWKLLVGEQKEIEEIRVLTYQRLYLVCSPVGLPVTSLWHYWKVVEPIRGRAFWEEVGTLEVCL